jgi:uncharacterized membrane protein YfcA
MALASFFTATLSGLIGMAGGVTLLALMTFVLEVQIIVPIHGCVQLISNASRSIFLRKAIVWDIFTPFFLLAPLGSLVAYYFLKNISSKELFLIPITVVIFYVLFKPKRIPEIKLGVFGFAVLGFFAGMLSPLIGATGPLLAPFFFREDLSKESIIATKAISQTWTHLLKIPVFLGLAFPYEKYALIIILMSMMAVLGTRFGTLLLGRISEDLFRLLYKVALAFAALRLLYKIFL